MNNRLRADTLYETSAKGASAFWNHWRIPRRLTDQARGIGSREREGRPMNTFIIDPQRGEERNCPSAAVNDAGGGGIQDQGARIARTAAERNQG